MNNAIEDFYPLSPLQQGMLFHALYAPDSAVYIEQIRCLLRGPLHAAAFEQAWRLAVIRHTILRTGFISGGLKEPVQAVHRSVPLSFARYDWSNETPETQKANIEQRTEADRALPFDAGSPPLMRFSLATLGNDTFHFTWTYHHILLDGWSVPLLLREVLAAYDAYVHGRTPVLPPVRPFRDYIVWLKKQNTAEAEGFWREHLRGMLHPTSLAFARSGAFHDRKEYRSQKLESPLSPAETKALQGAARKHGLTLNSIIQGAWALALSRFGCGDDILFGSTVSGRPPELPGVESMLGLFINTLPVRLRVPAAGNLLSWLADVQRHLAMLRRYEYSSLVQVQSWSEIPHTTPLFESLVVFENYPTREGTGQEGPATVRIEDLSSDDNINYPLALVAGAQQQFLLRLLFDPHRFDLSVIRSLIGYLERILHEVAAGNEPDVACLRQVSPEERTEIVEQWSGEKRGKPDSTAGSVLTMLQQQCAGATANERQAIADNGKGMTYGELHEQTDRLAVVLRHANVGPEGVVGLCMERSAGMVVGMVGVLKAGAAYLALDPATPAERLRFMTYDAHADVVVTDKATEHYVRATLGRPEGTEGDRREIRLLVLEDLLHGEGNLPAQRAWEEPDRHGAAYIVYTSGSTGKPKGVIVEHAGLANLVREQVKIFHITPESRVLQFASPSFDASVSEVFTALCAGACLVLAQRELLASAPALAALLRNERITTVTLPPSMLSVLAEPPAEERGDGGPSLCLETVVSAGESCRWSTARVWQRSAVRNRSQHRLLNAYGPSETTVCASWQEVIIGDERQALASDGETVPIGQPMGNVRLFVLDGHQRLIPEGVPGEICIGGAGVARGYLGRPDLTAEKFLPDPFSMQPGARLYRTGDRGRWIRSGEGAILEFLGREDRQVKVRGFRVELGEVEAVLGTHPGVREAAVIAHGNDASERRLTGYVVPVTLPPHEQGEGRGEAQELTPAMLRQYLLQHLPEYMVPSLFAMLDAMPLNASGKVDRQKLPDPSHAILLGADTAYRAPRTASEEVLATLWSQVLGIEHIGIHDNFFERGGHSLIATRLMARIRETFQVDMNLETLFASPTIEGLAKAIHEATWSAITPLQPVPHGETVPLSFAQERLWFLEQLEPGTAVYNLATAVRLKGQLSVELFCRCLDEIMRRHEILRTTFHVAEGRAAQRIHGSLEVPLEVTDLQSSAEGSREEAALRLMNDKAREPFDLSNGPLFRLHLTRVQDDECIALLAMHHIVADGWSLNLLVRELATLYHAFSQSLPSPLPSLRVQYADFALWQREWLTGTVLERQVAYWKEQLADAPQDLLLPVNRDPDGTATHRGLNHAFTISPEATERLRKVSRSEGSTMFMTLLSAFGVLLQRYSGSTDITIGTPVANRNRTELEGLIGFFVNTLVMRVRLDGNPSFKELLKRVRAMALGAYAHQDLPFETLVSAIHPQRDMARSPLFQVMFVMQNLQTEGLALPGLTFSPVPMDTGAAKFDLTLTVEETPDSISGTFEYDADAFDQGYIEQMSSHFVRLVTEISARPEAPVSQFSVMSPSEHAEIVEHWASGKGESAGGENVLAMLDRQSRAYSEHLAVTAEDSSGLSYHELAVRTDRLAAHLRARCGVGAETIVGVCFDRSPRLVEAIVSVLKAGGAYLALDPAAPPERLHMMLEDASVHVVLAETATSSVCAENAERTLLLLDVLEKELTTIDEPIADISPAADPHAAAYVVYTSGSTGKPKGAVIEHGGLANLVREQIRAFQISRESRVLQFASPSFDASVSEIFTALCAGATLVMMGSREHAEEDHQALFSAGELAALLHAERITTVTLPPSMLMVLLDDARRCGPAGDPTFGQYLRTVVSAGERCPADLARRWTAMFPTVRLLNAYGPSETTVCASWMEVKGTEDAAGASSVPIGNPLGNTRVYVLDERLQVVPPGVPGEIYIGGAGIGRGYLNRPEVTSEKFICDPFSTVPGTRLYRTGDRGRWTREGMLEFLGRQDHQVKVRGYRVELGEIEAVLSRHPSVCESVVTAPPGSGQHRRLVAHIVAAEGEEAAVTPGALRSYLMQHLPAYMVPSLFVITQQPLPRTTSGKVDRNRLTEPALPSGAGGGYPARAPRTPEEEILCTLWQQVLGVRNIGPLDNFFESGGDSILVIRVISLAAEKGLYLTPRDFFQAPTVEGLAQRAKKARRYLPEQGIVTGEVPLTPVQRWFFEHHPERPEHWNTSMMIAVDGPLDPEVLKKAVQTLARHHDALRLTFKRSDSGWSQRLPAENPEEMFDDVDLSHLSRREQIASLESTAAAIQRSLDLERGPLAKVAYFKCGRSSRLLLVFHHLVMDGVSWRILIDDLQRTYRQLSQGLPVQLPEKTTSFRQWAMLLPDLARSEEVRGEVEIWRSMQPAGTLEVPRDFSHGVNSYGSVDHITVSLDAESTNVLLHGFTAGGGAEPYEVLLAALALAVRRWTGTPSLYVELEGHGREDVFDGVDLSRTVGWFTSAFPVLFDLQKGCAPEEALSAVRSRLRSIPRRGLGYGLLRYLHDTGQIRQAMEALPSPQINFNYLGQFGGGMSGDALPLRIARESPGPEQDPSNIRSALLYVVAIVSGDELDIRWLYSRNLHKQKTVKKLAQAFLEELHAILRTADKEGRQR